MSSPADQNSALSDEEIVLSIRRIYENCLDSVHQYQTSASAGILGAISGGPDSTVLLYGLALFKQKYPHIPVITATVEHGLREESRFEAEAVGVTAASLGLEHQILVWETPRKHSGVLEAARHARYALLAQLAEQKQVSYLATAHTLDDQAETLLFRMSRGSGIAGLSGMSVSLPMDNLMLIRPFLGFSKNRLIATCEERSWSYFTDPSNSNPKYARPRWRQIMPILAEEGLTSERLSKLAWRCQRANAAFDFYTTELYEHIKIETDYEYQKIVLDAYKLTAAPDEVAIRTLMIALKETGRLSFLRLERVEGFFQLLKSSLPPLHEDKQMISPPSSKRIIKKSLGGTVIELKQNGHLIIIREAERSRGRKLKKV